MEIPEELQFIIETKALLLGVTEEKILEYIIQEYVPSTPEEKRLQIHRRDTTMAKFISENPNTGLAHAWANGYKVGWEHFQMRKSSPIFKREE